MTSKKKRKKQKRSGYREPNARATPTPTRAPASSRPGLLGSLFGPRATNPAMPTVRSSITRGIATVAGVPVLTVGTVILVFAAWLLTISIGFQGPLARLASLMSLPPVGTTFDAQLAGALFGSAGGPSILLAVLPFMVARAVVIGIALGLIVETLESGHATMDGARRGLWASPMVLIVAVIQLGFLIAGSFLAPLLGLGIGTLIQVGAVVAAVYLFVYAPVAQIREGRGVADSLTRSIRAARLPGTGSLGMAMLYVIPSVGILLFGGPGTGYDLNPPATNWFFVLFVNLLHVAMIATFAYRWMSIEDEVPEAVPRPAPRSRRR